MKNKTPQEAPKNPVERDREATQWLREQLRKAGWKSPTAFSVWKVVARKTTEKKTQEAVFVFPAHSEGQIKRFLYVQGWDVVAAVQYVDINAAHKDPDDPSALKVKGIVAKGSA
ncbi:MAG: hypothetical protein HY919_04570 [Elusimicrobia bacterium]|nr:hypothetical protein [Elusimicrobiota bacterium]